MLKVFALLLVMSPGLAQFWMRITPTERCVLDRLAKNEEVILRVEVRDPKSFPNFELRISIKDAEFNYYESQRFILKNEAKRNFIYTHLADTDAYVCLSSEQALFVKLKVDVKPTLPENLITSGELHDLENELYKAVTELTDFNTQNAKTMQLEESVLSENLALNSKVVKTSIFEGFLILAMSAVQYYSLRYIIQTYGKH